ELVFATSPARGDDALLRGGVVSKMHAVPDREPRAASSGRGARARARGDDARQGRRVAAGDGEDVDLRARSGLAVPRPEGDYPLAGALRRARARHRCMTAELARLVDGFRVTQTIHASVDLGIPDLLADGERAADDLAEASGADPWSLYRLLRALASLGILHE